MGGCVCSCAWHTDEHMNKKKSTGMYVPSVWPHRASETKYPIEVTHWCGSEMETCACARLSSRASTLLPGKPSHSYMVWRTAVANKFG